MNSQLEMSPFVQRRFRSEEATMQTIVLAEGECCTISSDQPITIYFISGNLVNFQANEVVYSEESLRLEALTDCTFIICSRGYISFSGNGSGQPRRVARGERFALPYTSVEQIGTTGQFEVLRMTAIQGKYMRISPNTAGEAMTEWLYIEQGRVRIGTEEWGPGHFFFADRLQDEVMMEALQDASCIYISTKPQYEQIATGRKQLMQLAVEVERKDGRTAEHCQRLRQMAVGVGRRFNFSVYETSVLGEAAFLHDVGKLHIREEILLKPGKLTDEEYELVKQHTTYGYDLLVSIPLPSMPKIARIVEQHHERFDGRGYPHGLASEQILLEARIIAVVDSYDAMTNERVYSTACTREEAFAELRRCSGTMYDPQVVEQFIEMMEENPFL